MNTALKVLLIIALASCSSNNAIENPGTPPPVPSQEEPEVLNQGPMHESFAQPVELNPQAGIIAADEPPPLIVENPSAERPKGSNYVWIPGYWAWDTDRNDYVWVSGCWRIPPANMSWVPGYWTKAGDGWQWVAGFWIPTSRAKQIEYLPTPPEITATEPPVESTSSYDIWVPPCYYWVNNQYVLRAGYWLTPYDNWVWVPSCYRWTPYGYVFVPGYWDYVLSTRGVLYAPVYFPRRYHRIPGYSYSLSVIVDIDNLDFCLFSYPRYSHYYFGDYYSDFYLGIGIYPWYECRTRHFWYDPIFMYDHWRYRRSIPHWSEHIEREYSMRRDDINLRPPRTYRDLETRLARAPENQRRELRTVEPLRDNVAGKRNTLQMSRMSDNEQQRVRNQSNEVNVFSQERNRIETRQPIPERGQPSSRGSGVSSPRNSEQRQPSGGVSPGRSETRARTESSRSDQPRGLSDRQTPSSRSTPEKMTFPRSPVTGKSSGGLGGLFGGGKSSPRSPASESRMSSDGSGSRSQRDDGGGSGGRQQGGGGEGGGRNRR